MSITNQYQSIKLIIMNEIIIMPSMAKQRINLGEYAEEAVIVEDTIIRTPCNLHFIEANTQEVDLNHLLNDCITPVFSKDNELTINHAISNRSLIDR